MHYPTDWKEEYSKQGLCGVLATAMAGEVTIERAHKVLSQNLMPHQKRHVKATYTPQIIASLKALGKYIVEYEPERTTVRRWVERNALFGITYVIFTGGHVLTFRDGLLCDQEAIAPMMEHRSKRQFVKKIVEVVS